MSRFLSIGSADAATKRAVDEQMMANLTYQGAIIPRGEP